MFFLGGDLRPVKVGYCVWDFAKFGLFAHSRDNFV